MVFCAPDIGGGGTQANKSSYSPTIICGSNSAGKALPPHFQLKSTAKTDARERFNMSFLQHPHNVNAQFGHTERKLLPCTLGMNDKAGMNAEELDKYFHKSILPLYPDTADTKGLRVLAKVDSGPGRMNLPMLAALRSKCLCLVPGIPNTTGKTQETDQNHGPFKTCHCSNLALLAQSRFEKKKTNAISDLPLIVFGGTDPETHVVLKNAFELAFNHDQCISAWNKCGAIPLTRSVLQSPNICHKVILNPNRTINEEMDPEGYKLLKIEASNHLSCDFLSSFGFDGKQLRLDAPRKSTKKYKLAEPHSKERIEQTDTEGTVCQSNVPCHSRATSQFG